MGRVIGVGSSAHRKVTAKRPSAGRLGGGFEGIDKGETTRVCRRNADAVG